MLANAAFVDLRGYIKRRVAYARYRVSGTYHKTDLTDVLILEDGTVRAQLSILPENTVTVDRVELFNSDGELWAYQNCNIEISTGQTGILYWFDFYVAEKEV